jgi:4-hydroxy-2-oxoheptanedioate aldolase
VLKENPVKKKIHQGQVVLGSYCNPLRPYLIELMAEAEYDFVVLDTEHGPFYGVEQCVEGVKTAKVSGITPFIRVSHNNPILIQKALAIGAQGVWVPHVDSASECLRAVQASKFPPDGH